MCRGLKRHCSAIASPRFVFLISHPLHILGRGILFWEPHQKRILWAIAIGQVSREVVAGHEGFPGEGGKGLFNLDR